MDYMGDFQHHLILALTLMMSMVVLLATAELAYLLARYILTPHYFAGCRSASGYLRILPPGSHRDRAARNLQDLRPGAGHQRPGGLSADHDSIARKVIILDVKTLPSTSLLGIGVIIWFSLGLLPGEEEPDRGELHKALRLLVKPGFQSGVAPQKALWYSFLTFMAGWKP